MLTVAVARVFPGGNLVSQPVTRRLKELAHVALGVREHCEATSRWRRVARSGIIGMG
ncbi:MAG: hypothetical protein ABGZ17_13520 [Planctomycetaceae bacterium]